MHKKTFKGYIRTRYILPSLFYTVITSASYGQDIDESEKLEELASSVVVGEETQETSNPDFLKSLRFTSDLKTTPITTQVISESVLEDLQPTDLRNILDFTAGVSQGNSFANTNDNFSIRGFNANIAENGIAVNSTTGGGVRQRNAATIESVEVVRGPQSALFGQGIGGTINVVTKRPEIGQFFRTRSRYSSEGLLRQEFDFNTSVGSLDEYRFRLISSFEDDDVDFRDRVNGDSSFVRGIFQYQPNDNFTLTLGAEYTNRNAFFDRGVPIDLDGNLLVDRNVNLTPSGFGNTDIQTSIFDIDLDYKISDNWSIHHLSRYQENSLEGQSASVFNVFSVPVPLGALDPAFGTAVLNPFQDVTRSLLSRDTNSDLFTTRTELKGIFETGALKHEALLGFDYSSGRNVVRNVGSSIAEQVLLAVDVQDLVIEPAFIPPFGIPTPTTTDQEIFGVSLFDKISINDSLNVTLGGRFDFVDLSFGGDSTLDDIDETAFSPTAGINYSFNDNFSAYGVYSEAFLVNEPDINGNVLDPREARNIEVGVRYDIPGTKLSATASVFDIEETNRATADSLITGAAIESGTFTSQGFDFVLQGEITDNISVILNYVYNDTEFTETANSLALGSPEAAIPENQASLFVNYDFSPGDDKGLSLNAGIVYVGERIDAVPTTLLGLIPRESSTLQDYVRVDLGGRYDFGKHKSIGVRIENVFDTNIEINSLTNTVIPQAPRTAFVTFDWEF